MLIICAIWHSKSAQWPSWVPVLCLSSSPFWTPFLRFFESGLALGLVFNPYSKNQTPFLMIQVPIAMIILWINTPKVLIIHNLIVI